MLTIIVVLGTETVCVIIFKVDVGYAGYVPRNRSFCYKIIRYVILMSVVLF